MAKLLVVNHDRVMSLTTHQAEHGDEVVTLAHDGPKTLAAFKGDRFHLLLLGISSPDLDGPGMRRTPDVPIGVITGRAHSSTSISQPDYPTMTPGAVSALLTHLVPASDCLAPAGKTAALSWSGSDAISHS